MTKVRQDAWSEENDLLLAETVLRHIREGSTQLNAFEEVGDVLNRTSAACGFRWNAVVRNQYEQAIELAKRQRKERKRANDRNWKAVHSNRMTIQQTSDNSNVDEDNSITFHDVYQFLQSIEKSYEARNHSVNKTALMEQKNIALMKENESLKKDLKRVSDRLQTVETDYQTFIQIMDRARKLTLFDEKDDVLPTPMFKMDKNGNLEQYVQG